MKKCQRNGDMNVKDDYDLMFMLKLELSILIILVKFEEFCTLEISAYKRTCYNNRIRLER